MTSSHRTVTGAGLAGGIVLTAAVLTGGTAGAASAALAYSCDYGFGEERSLLGTGLLALGGTAGTRWTRRHSASRRH